MSKTEITRAFSMDEADHTGRIIEGLAFEWDNPEMVSDGGPSYLEEFARASCDKTISDRPKRPLGILHPWSPGARTSPIPIGAVTFQRSAQGLVYTATFSRTQAGDEALELKNDGALGDVSIGGRPIRNSERYSADGRVVRREEIAIRELSLAPAGMGQRQDAKILVHRAEVEGDTPVLDRYKRRAALFL